MDSRATALPPPLLLLSHSLHSSSFIFIVLYRSVAPRGAKRGFGLGVIPFPLLLGCMMCACFGDACLVLCLSVLECLDMRLHSAALVGLRGSRGSLWSPFSLSPWVWHVPGVECTCCCDLGFREGLGPTLIPFSALLGGCSVSGRCMHV